MARRNKNIIKYRKPLRINVGLILFLFLFLYLVIVVISYFTRTRLQIYQVESGSFVNDQVYTGLILRDEQIYTMDQAGYVDFYIRQGRKAGVDDIVYTIDVNGTFSQQLQASLEGMDSFSAEEILSIKESLYSFSSAYEDMDFSKIYTVKNNLTLEIINDISNSALENISDLVDSGSFIQGKSDLSGVVSYYLDGYEQITESDLTHALMEKSAYETTMQHSGTLLEAGTPIFKMIPNEDWNLIIEVDEEKYQELNQILNSEDESVSKKLRFRILDTDQEISAPYTLFTGADGSRFCELQMTKFSSAYADNRFLDIELIYEQQYGLKIPKSAVTTQSFFVIPKEYAAYGGNQNVFGFTRQAIGSDTVEFISPTFYALIDGYYYVNQKDFTAGDRLFMPDSQEQYIIADTKELQGVYNINRGYALFRQVIILDETGDIYLIEKGTTYGLAVYDHIILDKKGIKEFDVIY